MRTLADVVVADPSDTGMVDFAAHIPGYATMKASQLKKAYANSFSGDFFFLFTLEVFWALHPILDQFFCSCVPSVGERHPFPPISVVTGFF